MTQRNFVLVPVKPPGLGKSRLSGMPVDVRRALAHAFALDVLTAATGAPNVESVVLVGDDPGLAREALELGCALAPDAGTLNRSLVSASIALPGAATVVAICADLPALRAEDLSALLESLPADRSAFVPDAAGSGTTAYAAVKDRFDPMFGPESRAAHVRQGALEVGLDRVRLRSDVDSMDDLRAAWALGLGPHTGAALNATRGHQDDGDPAVAF